MKWKPSDSTEYKFTLIQHSREILTENGRASDHNFEDQIFTLAERIHAWINNPEEKKQ